MALGKRPAFFGKKGNFFHCKLLPLVFVSLFVLSLLDSSCDKNLLCESTFAFLLSNEFSASIVLFFFFAFTKCPERRTKRIFTSTCDGIEREREPDFTARLCRKKILPFRKGSSVFVMGLSYFFGKTIYRLIRRSTILKSSPNEISGHFNMQRAASGCSQRRESGGGQPLRYVILLLFFFWPWRFFHPVFNDQVMAWLFFFLQKNNSSVLDEYKRLHKMNFDHFNAQRVTRKEQKDFHLQWTWKHFLNIKKHHQFDTLLRKKNSELWTFQRVVGLLTFSLNALIQNNMCGSSTLSQNVLRFPRSWKSPGRKIPSRSQTSPRTATRPSWRQRRGQSRDSRGRPIRGFPPFPPNVLRLDPFLMT